MQYIIHIFYTGVDLVCRNNSVLKVKQHFLFKEAVYRMDLKRNFFLEKFFFTPKAYYNIENVVNMFSVLVKGLITLKNRFEQRPLH